MASITRLTNPADLQAVIQEETQRVNARISRNPTEAAPGKTMRYVLLCTGGGCVASGALDLKKAFLKEIKRLKLTRCASVVDTGCMGPCAVGPVAAVYPEGTLYAGLTPADVKTIAREHLVGGRIVKRLVAGADAKSESPDAERKGYQFLDRQTKIVLRNCGIIDPTNIRDYFGRDGYKALATVLSKMTPDQMIEELKKSGLRGRGGAGFPTWLKWQLTKKAVGDVKYVLCNADEGDPGAFMDRSVLEGDPHSVIEAMIIAAYTIGSKKGFVYVRAEYPLAVERLGIAIKDARQWGLLGKNILGTNFEFDLDIRMGSGAFVCGEETALMTSIEGNRGEPRPRPPFPANKGLWGKPSLLNNVETYAAIPAIILKGAGWYAGYGTEKSKGTKIFALAGAVNTTGLVEIPIGTPLGEIVFDIGGGIPKGKAYKAAQIGGPSGGCIPKQHLNVPVDYESLAELGAIMGSGGLIVMDEDTCMVDVARYFLDFVQDESCGKCVPCRVGTKRMLEILDRICRGEGKMEDLDALETLGRQIKDTALCGLGQTAPNPVLSTMRHFRDEYIAHIRDKHCPAGVCPELVRAPCQNACPAGVNVPGFVSLVGEGRYEEGLRLHRERNPFAAVCASVCFHPCEFKCRRQDLDSSVAIKSVKRFMVEKERKIAMPEIRANPENARRKIAVIGAGPAGLSCAYFLARLGYKPTVFEAEKKAGGMLVQTIPAYRLPRKTLEREIELIKKMGVQIKTGYRLGKNITLPGLRKSGYEAVCLSIGMPKGAKLGLPNEDAKGVVDALDFLREYNLKGSTAVGKKVAVIGGGNAAVDVARTALRLGAGEVSVLYRRTRDQMPAWDEEVNEAVREGVKFEFLIAPVGLVTSGGRVTGLKCRRMKLGEFDRGGRRKPVDGDKAEFTVEADQVVAAIGQTLAPSEVFDGISPKLSRDNRVETDPVTGVTSADWLFAAGDVVTGPASVVGAVAGGEQAAVGIDRHLTGTDNAFWRRETSVDTAFDPDADPVSYEKLTPATLSPEKRRGNFREVDLVAGEAAVKREARRCLRCDYRCESK